MGVDAREVQIVHVVLSILEGRSSEVRSEYGRRIFEALRAFFPETESVKVSLTVEIREMDSQSYFKN
jgi:5-carboxymethyl-2-hydroxymuconate isomerase